MSDPINSWYTASANRELSFPTLDANVEADVCIIGGGYTGLSSAIHLREKGYSVVLLEAERVGWGASGRNGGHCSVGQRNDQDELEASVGKDHARQLWGLGLEAVDTVCDLIQRHDIQCELKSGDLHVAAKPGEIDAMQRYVEKLNRDYDYQEVRYVDKTELQSMSSTRRYYGGCLDTRGRHLHPLNYALGLAAAAAKLGASIYEQSRAISYRQGEGVEVETGSGTVKAKYLVLGCNGYLEKLAPLAARRIMPINNYILATEPLPETTARALIRDDCAMSDSLFVINYWKLSADNRLLFGGGETYTKRFPKDMKTFVRKHMLATYPELDQVAIDYAWGGTLAVTVNRMPSFGRIGANIFYAQGYSGHGVPIATLAGKLISEAVAGTAERFDIMATVPTPIFPGGTLLRWPGLVLGMAWYAMLDRL
ncbi:FAD-binding oxidoreductase [Halieaceae bacterium IMCC14734]|uniref:FAD-binding oxidoreductase n=1 Tax=Candidatus Litorirhabdus singularis TaxID=2518993 RepID=A0ABT3TD34_9GAMM|nr:FAD-binding oxidoreductase [Candidatus Litorirhabdus singularis]MCX2979730.1 FAD-binding oxidoreductase [Candidatus Litorirhabdus singularis]